jgi:glutaredoxin
MQGVSKPILYIKQGCPYCAAAIEYLREHNVDFETIDVRGNQEEMRKLEEISGKTCSQILTSISSADSWIRKTSRHPDA